MVRTAVGVRDAVPADAELLASLWSSVLRPADHDRHVDDVTALLERCDDPATAQRVLVAELGDAAAGAALVRLASAGPLDPRRTLQVHYLAVAQGCRRRGVGRALMDAVTQWAEQAGAETVTTAVTPGEREVNRFMARLGLTPLASVRQAPTAVVRARLAARRQAVATGPGTAGTPSNRHLTRVLAARRSMRREDPAG